MQHPRAIQVFQPPNDAKPRRRKWLVFAAIFFPISLSGQVSTNTDVRFRTEIGDRLPDRPDIARLLRHSAKSSALGVLPAQQGLASASSITSLTASAAANPFHFAGSTTDLGRATECLAMAAWYEAGDNREDQRSVMQVVLNRVAHPAFPNSVCGVVFQGSQLSTGCQFTFTCDGSIHRRRPNGTALDRVRQAALGALEGATYAPVAQATHYHADYVQPWWSGSMLQLTKVGRHIFYRLRGRKGVLPGTLGALGGEPDIVSLLARSNRPGGVDADETAGALSDTDSDLVPAAHSQALAPLVARRQVTNTHFLQLDPASAAGRWALSALAQCTGKKECQVVGYGDAGSVEGNRALPAGQRARPLFLFLRDGASGIELALWDCQRVSRPDASQCLPSSGPQLDRLLREREG